MNKLIEEARLGRSGQAASHTEPSTLVKVLSDGGTGWLGRTLDSLSTGTVNTIEIATHGCRGSMNHGVLYINPASSWDARLMEETVTGWKDVSLIQSNHQSGLFSLWRGGAFWVEVGIGLTLFSGRCLSNRENLESLLLTVLGSPTNNRLPWEWCLVSSEQELPYPLH